ncbi:hypothetical protein AURDEDRAFT_160724 [Auricularia subglabra TFB-10046 SS5]|nr:hypothetical protein AURDEDRAFT_160724 [Auricularia subglabra TFB-10046 SS5]
MTPPLPVDIWRMIFGDLTLREALRLTPVCSLWRSVIIESDAYLSDIRLQSRTWASIHFFRLRMGRIGDRIVSVTVFSEYPWELLETEIIPAIVDKLSRIGRLSIHCHIADADAVLAALMGSAPRLHTLRVYFTIDERASPPLPILPLDLLSGNAADLRKVELGNIDFGDGSVAPALFLVNDFRMGCVSQELLPAHHIRADIWRYLPGLQTLGLSGDLVLPASLHNMSSWKALQYLVLDLESAYSSVALDGLPLADIPTIQFFHPFNAAAELCAAYLRGPLDVTIRYSEHGSTEHIHVTDERQRCRIFSAALWTRDGLWEIVAVFETLRLYDMTFAMTLDLRDLVRPSGLLTVRPLQFASMTDLHLVFKPGEPLPDPTTSEYRLECPALRRLTLQYETDVPVPLGCDAVRAFYQGAFRISGDRRPLPILGLHNAVLTGPHDCLDDHFGDIVRSDGGNFSRSYPEDKSWRQVSMFDHLYVLA